MKVEFNPVSFKANYPASKTEISGQVSADQNSTPPISKSEQTGIETNIQNQNKIVKEEKQPKSLKETTADFWKFLASVNQLANAYVKGLIYATATGAALLSGSWVFNTLPKVFKKEGPKLTQVLRHPLKNISTSGKIIAGAGSIAVMGYYAVRGKLDANQRTAEIDHKMKTGHRDA